MGRDSDDDAWRAIVENYGDRVELDDDPPLDLLHDVDPGERGDDEGREDRDAGHGRRHSDGHRADELRFERRFTDRPAVPDDDRFVPPPPPPLPVVARDRMLAWIGLFGSPAILLITLVLGIALPPWLGYLLVAGFLGGFGYLVVKMPRGPADPWDDGARL